MARMTRFIALLVVCSFLTVLNLGGSASAAQASGGCASAGQSMACLAEALTSAVAPSGAEQSKCLGAYLASGSAFLLGECAGETVLADLPVSDGIGPQRMKRPPRG